MLWFFVFRAAIELNFFDVFALQDIFDLIFKHLYIFIASDLAIELLMDPDSMGPLDNFVLNNIDVECFILEGGVPFDDLVECEFAEEPIVDYHIAWIANYELYDAGIN